MSSLAGGARESPGRKHVPGIDCWLRSAVHWVFTASSSSFWLFYGLNSFTGGGQRENTGGKGAVAGFAGRAVTGRVNKASICGPGTSAGGRPSE